MTKKPKDQIVDIDAADGANELAVAEYIDELYGFYKLSEVNSPLPFSVFFLSHSPSLYLTTDLILRRVRPS